MKYSKPIVPLLPGPDLAFVTSVPAALVLKYFRSRCIFQPPRAKAGHYSNTPIPWRSGADSNTKPLDIMRLSLIGMAGSGKSYWSCKFAEHGFRRFCCDDMIEAKLAPELTRSDGTMMNVTEWMGFPFEPRYQEYESQYLVYETEVLTEILDYLENRENNPQENIVVDTTGSVIYIGEEILGRLQRYTTIVYLATLPEVQEQLLNAYISNPHPMLWRGFFSKEPNETNHEALARCYPRLFFARKLLYERYADVTIDYYRRREQGFGVSDFLRAVDISKGEAPR